MNWMILITALLVVGAFFAINYISRVSARAALDYLACGGVLIDVRTESEFHTGHLPGALNIPLKELRRRISREIKDKARPLLVHCLSGGRSAIAMYQLKGLGYFNSFNLGSYARARAILAQASSSGKVPVMPDRAVN